jgi:hypothetical protein
MPTDVRESFYRGIFAECLAAGRELAKFRDFLGFRSLVDVGGGSGGLAIAMAHHHLRDHSPLLSAQAHQLRFAGAAAPEPKVYRGSRVSSAPPQSACLLNFLPFYSSHFRVEPKMK